jgi:hypothetical protein
MDLGKGCDRNFEVGHALEPGHQVSRVAIALRMRFKIGAGRRVAPQRNNMANPSLPVGPRHFVHLVPARAHAGQVGGRHERGLADQPGHGRMRPLLRRAARTIGYGHEAGPQGLEPPDASPELLLERLGLRGKELEGEQGRGMARTANGQACEAGARHPSLEARRKGIG